MISNAIAVHNCDVKKGKLVEPSEENNVELVAYEHMLATESDDDTIGEDHLLDVDMSLDDTIYPSHDFTIFPPRHLPPEDTYLDSSYRPPIS